MLISIEAFGVIVKKKKILDEMSIIDICSIREVFQ